MLKTLNGIVEDGFQDLSWSWKALLIKFARKVLSNPAEKYPDEVRDNLSHYDQAKLAHFKFRKSEVNDDNSKGSLSVIRFGGVIPGVIDNVN